MLRELRGSVLKNFAFYSAFGSDGVITESEKRDLLRKRDKLPRKLQNSSYSLWITSPLCEC